VKRIKVILILIMIFSFINCAKKIASVKVANIGRVDVFCQIEGFSDERIKVNEEKHYEFEFDSKEYIAKFTIWSEEDENNEEIKNIILSNNEDYYLTVGWEN